MQVISYLHRLMLGLPASSTCTDTTKQMIPKCGKKEVFFERHQGRSGAAQKELFHHLIITLTASFPLPLSLRLQSLPKDSA